MRMRSILLNAKILASVYAWDNAKKGIEAGQALILKFKVLAPLNILPLVHNANSADWPCTWMVPIEPQFVGVPP